MGVDQDQEAHPRRTPIFNVPGVVIAIIAVLVAIQAYRSQLSLVDDFTLSAIRGFVPARLALEMGWISTDDLLKAIADRGEVGGLVLALLKLLEADEANVWTSLVTYAGLHADWGHVTLNALWFLAFGSVVARRLGTVLFILFFLVGAIGAALTYALFNLTSIVPMIGASGAVSAAMGAALLLPFRPIGDPEILAELQYVPLMPVRVALTDSRVVGTTLVWFAMNALLAFGFGAPDTEVANIAWEAHLGGYLIGMVLIYILDRFRPMPALAVSRPTDP